MSESKGSVDMSKELAALQHERKNQKMRKLPPNTTVQRRPLMHPVVASPSAGPHVQKVVYVSCRTPIMSAVKRVKKLLQHVEKRAMQGIEAKSGDHARLRAELATASQKLAQDSEEVLVKASGRAMEQALRVGEWFKTKETEMVCKVEVRTGSVAAIDDIVETPTKDTDSDDDELDETGATTTDAQHTTLEGGDTTMELLGGTSAHPQAPSQVEGDDEGGEKSTLGTENPKKRRRRRKRKRETYDTDDIPEARIRWVKTVEVAISLIA